MAEGTYDCLVIGSGPGGYVAAIRAAQLGKAHLAKSYSLTMETANCEKEGPCTRHS